MTMLSREALSHMLFPDEAIIHDHENTNPNIRFSKGYISADQISTLFPDHLPKHMQEIDQAHEDPTKIPAKFIRTTSGKLIAVFIQTKFGSLRMDRITYQIDQNGNVLSPNAPFEPLHHLYAYTGITFLIPNI